VSGGIPVESSCPVRGQVDHGHGSATRYSPARQSCSSSLAQAALPVKISNGSSKDVLFKIAHTAGLPHQAVGYSCFFLILTGRLAALTADVPAADVLNIAQTT
jgi:hypothetical protein